MPKAFESFRLETQTNQAHLMEKYLCRVCWNQNTWIEPCGTSKGERNTFASRNHFGHEEWLKQPKWVEGGRRYAFLQPFRSTPPGFVAAEILLFTKNPNLPAGSNRFFVGKIRHCRKLSLSDSQHAFALFSKRGWLKQMQMGLRTVSIPHTLTTTPRDIFNVEFKLSDILWFSTPKLAPSGDYAYRCNHYHLYQI